MLSRVTSSSVRMAAAIHGRAEFLAPLTRIVPSRGLPPRITNLSIRRPLFLGILPLERVSAASRVRGSCLRWRGGHCRLIWLDDGRLPACPHLPSALPTPPEHCV